MESNLVAPHDGYDVRSPSLSALDQFLSGFGDRITHQEKTHSTTPPAESETALKQDASSPYPDSRNVNHPPPGAGGTALAMDAHHHPLPMAYSFDPIPGARHHKRPARRHEEIKRKYKCGWDGCERAFGTLNHLNAHITMQSHGSRRLLSGPREIPSSGSKVLALKSSVQEVDVSGAGVDSLMRDSAGPDEESLRPPERRSKESQFKSRAQMKSRRQEFMKAFLDHEGGYKGSEHPGGRNNNKPNPQRKLRPSVNDLDVPVKDAITAEQTTPDVDIRPETFGANLQDTNSEVSGSHDWKISAAGGADGILVRADISEARSSLHYDRQEAAPPSEPRSTQTETALEDKTHRHDDVNFADFPVLSTIPEKDTTEEAPNAEWALVGVNSLFEHTPEDGKVDDSMGVNLDRGDAARKLAQDSRLVDENSKERTQDQSTLKLQLQLEEDEVALEDRTAPPHVQDIDDMLPIDGASDEDSSTPAGHLGLSHDVYDKSGDMPPESAKQILHQHFNKDSFLDSLSSVQSTRDDFWSNPDSGGDRPFRRGTPGTSPERGYLQRSADQYRLPYLYEERHGRLGSRPDLLLDRDPQRSVSILEDIAQYAYKVERVNHTKLPQPSKLLDDITKSLFCTRELEPILAAACKDVDIGAERLEQNLRRLIQLFGEELKSEATDARELEAARAMMTPEVSSYIAWSILQHVKAASSKPDRVEAPQTGPSKVYGTDAGHWETFRRLRSLLMPATTSFRTFEEEVIWMNRNQDLNTKEVELVFNAATLHESKMALQSAKRVSALTYIAFVYLPLSFSASFFGMNMQDTGKTQHEYGWLLAPLFLTTVCILLAFHLSAMLRDHHMIGIPPISTSGTHTLLYNSDAYDIFRAGLLDSVHEPYEKRILLAIGGEVEQSGLHLEQDSIHYVAREISWVPVQFFTYPSDTDPSCAGAAKAFVEDRLGESWNWWPLAPRIHRPRSGYCRIQWKSVCISISKPSIDA